VIDTSALVAALVADHEHHTLVRPHLAEVTAVPAIVLAETFSQLRRTFGQSATAAAALLAPWAADRKKVLPTSAAAVTATFARSSELDLAGNVHDALIAQACLERGVRLRTLDGRQHRLALAMGADSVYLLA
jgi:predicted nucleic acid-binding protein